MKTAVVILNWNGKTLLEAFLPSVVQYSSMKDVKIYVADNASTDDSVNFIIENYPQVTIIKNAGNYGYAGGYNSALEGIDADIFALVNSDVSVTENWLAPVIQQFINESDTGVIQPKILDFKKKDHFEYAGAGGGLIDALGYPYCRGRIFNTLEIDKGQYNDISSIFWASGACFFIRATLFNDLNGFDESYFAHQEEIDLCWRVKNNGLEVRYNGNSVVYHVGGATLKESAPRKTFLNFRNSLFTLLKNQLGKDVFPTLLLRLILDGIAGIKFFLELRPVHTLAIIRAHFSFYKHFPSMIRKRAGLKQQQHSFSVRSIVWKYFILGKRRIDEL